MHARTRPHARYLATRAHVHGRRRGAFFYVGVSGGGKRSLQNIGYTHRWSTAADRDGDTFCVKRTSKAVKCGTQLSYGGYDLKRVAVAGRITPASIVKACKAKKLVPVCNLPSAMDGSCLLVSLSANW